MESRNDFESLRQHLSTKKRKDEAHDRKLRRLSQLFHGPFWSIRPVSEQKVHQPIKPIQNTRDGDGFPPEMPDKVVHCILQHVQAWSSPATLLNCMLVCKKWSRIGIPILYRNNRISQLPEEIIVNILQRVRDTQLFVRKQEFSSYGLKYYKTNSISDLVSCIQTCQQWRRIGTPLLYQRFVLDLNYEVSYKIEERPPVAFYVPSGGSYAFAPSHNFRLSRPWEIENVSRWMQSLTIELHFMQPVRSLGQTISIPKVLAALSTVTTFSLRAAPLKRDNLICRKQLSSIVHALPENIVNFELDTQGRDSSSTSVREYLDLCNALSSKLSQFNNLRLRLSVICPLLLACVRRKVDNESNSPNSTQLPKLRSAVIHVYSRDLSQRPVCCSPHQWNCVIKPAHQLFQKLQREFEEGTFPNIRKFVLIGIHPDFGPNHPSPQIEIKRYDFEAKSWNEERLIAINALPNDNVFYRRPLLHESTPGLQDPIQKAHIYWRKHGQHTDEWMEKDAAWMQDRNGARIPQGMSSSNGRFRC